MLPLPHDLGVRRLQEEFGVEVVEYPTTRVISPPEARAADVNAAFADPDIKAIVASIGGEDQIKILKHLDADVIAANPKPFFGVSDNTNLHNYLWNLGIVSYYGGAVMVELGRPGAINPHTAEAFRAAFLGEGWYDLRPAETYTDVNGDWADPATFEREPEMFPGTGWQWHGGNARGRGPAVGRLLRDHRLQPAGRALPRAGRHGVRRVRAVPRDHRGAAHRPVRRRGADVPRRTRPAPALPGPAHGPSQVVVAPRPEGRRPAPGVRRCPARGGAGRDGGVLPRRPGGDRRRLRPHRPAAGDAQRRRGPDRPGRADRSAVRY